MTTLTIDELSRSHRLSRSNAGGLAEERKAMTERLILASSATNSPTRPWWQERRPRASARSAEDGQ